MNRKTSLVILTLLLTSMLTLAFNIRRVRGSIIKVPSDYPTIQQAVNAASDGDTILVSSGQYFENIVIYSKSISLIGHSPSDTSIKGVSEVG